MYQLWKLLHKASDGRTEQPAGWEDWLLGEWQAATLLDCLGVGVRVCNCLGCQASCMCACAGCVAAFRHCCYVVLGLSAGLVLNTSLLCVYMYLQTWCLAPLSCTP